VFDDSVAQSEDAAPPTIPERRPLCVDQLRAVVAALDGHGDGTVTWTDRVQIEKRYEDVVRIERVLDEATVAELREMPAGQPWRAVSDARQVGDGWIAVTDPTTGEVHEIRAADATHVWRARAR